MCGVRLGIGRVLIISIGFLSALMGIFSFQMEALLNMAHLRQLISDLYVMFVLNIFKMVCRQGAFLLNVFKIEVFKIRAVSLMYIFPRGIILALWALPVSCYRCFYQFRDPCSHGNTPRRSTNLLYPLNPDSQ